MVRRIVDHFSHLIDRQHRFLLIGIVLFIMTAVFTLSGETLEAHYPGIVSRAKEPKRFWLDIVIFFVGGLFFIGLFLYKNSN
jgi:hypothetical protein